jgi:hypothetical protein
VSERKPIPFASQPVEGQPAAALHWWQIMAHRQVGRLPFGAIYDEALMDADQVGLDEEMMLLLRESRIVEPIEGWQSFYCDWDDDFVEDWFDEGEALQHSTLEVEIDEPDRMERTLGWLRSLFIASNQTVRTA